MEGVAGYLYYQLKKPIEITSLKINGKEVMVDDPLHWIGMNLLAKHCKGKVLIGGLGLGLIIHALFIEGENALTKIDVAEVNPDVSKLISPFLPHSPKVELINKDIFTMNASDYDTVVLDLWVKGEKDSPRVMGMDMLRAFTHFKAQNANNNIYIWGMGESIINPAVDPKVRKMGIDHGHI